jgi:mRNA interferase MazF
MINLDPTIGAEIRKIRPAVIINHNDLGVLPLKIIIPITEYKSHYDNAPWMVKILPNIENGLTKISSIDALQIRSVSIERFVNKIGEVDLTNLNRIEEALFQILDL